ncbi:HAD family hydrolase [Gudongella sp. SC589]|jgi:HAD superfamily hydrolase (TIGR01509 family)|uniref:HAD family hydrolase n=1 Tax=Gudongella sp. SC589 TaxID=3385990 RepID=UPI003904D5BF
MKFAIFDLDGTLLDSMWVWETLAYDYLISRGIEAPEDIRDKLREYSLREASDVLKEMYDLPERGEEINDQMEKVLEKYYFDKIQLKEGAREVLQAMKDKGIKMCAATATADHLAKAAMVRLEIDEYFEFLQTCKSTGIEKYKPEFYQLILDRVGESTEDIWVFEDALHSMEAAKKLGIKVAAIRDQSAKIDWQEIEEVADIVFDSFPEYLEKTSQ